MSENKIASFDAVNSQTFGDILNVKKANCSIKVGLLGCGYFEYWRMYPSLKGKVENDLQKVYKRLCKDFKVVYPCMVDTLDKAEEAGKAFADANVEVIIVVEGTYLPDFITLHAIEHVSNAQIILFDTQTGSDISPNDNYEATMRNSAFIGISQLTGTFRGFLSKGTKILAA